MYKNVLLNVKREIYYYGKVFLFSVKLRMQTKFYFSTEKYRNFSRKNKIRIWMPDRDDLVIEADIERGQHFYGDDMDSLYCILYARAHFAVRNGSYRLL